MSLLCQSVLMLMLVFTSCGVVVMVSGFTVTGRMSVRRNMGELHLQEKEFDIDSIVNEAEAALIAAEAAIKKSSTEGETTDKGKDKDKDKPTVANPITTTKSSVQEKTTTTTTTKAPNKDPLAPEIASTIGAFGVGAVLGGALELGFDAALLQVVGDITIIPILLGAGFAAVTYNTVQKDQTKAAELIKGTVGKATNTAVSGVSSVAERAAEEVAAVPGKVATAAKNKVDETVEDIASEIKAVPGKVATAAKNKVDETVEEITSEIKAVPQKVADAASQKARQTAEEIRQIPVKAADTAKQRAIEVVQDVKAAPGRVATTTKQAVDRTVDNIASNTKRTLAQMKDSVLDQNNKSNKMQPSSPDKFTSDGNDNDKTVSE